MALAYDGTSIWVVNDINHSIMKINPITGAVGAEITVGRFPVAIAYDGTSIWVANFSDGSVMRSTR